MTEILHTSSSQLGLFKKCQQAWAFRYQYGLKIPPSIQMIQGTAFDRAESHNFEQKIKSQEDVKLSVVEDVLHETYQEQTRVRQVIINNEGLAPVEEEEDGDIDPNEAENTALAGLRVFHESHARKVMPISSQRAFSVPLNGLDKPYTLDGIIDIEAHEIEDFEAGKVGKNKAIMDLKLLGKSPGPGEAIASEQLTAYDAAFLAETGAHAPQLALLVTVKLKTPKVQFMPTTRTDEDTQRFLKGLGNVVHQVELVKEGKIAPTPAAPGAWWCSPKQCGYWPFCPVRPKE